MPTVIADSGIMYQSKKYQAGDSFEATKEDADWMVKQGVAHVEKAKEAPKAAPKPEQPKQPEGDTKPVSEMNRTELEAHAKSVGLAGPYDQYDTKAKLIEAIKAHQEEGKQ